MLYGVSPLPDAQDLLQTVVTWTARVTLVKHLPAGHGVSYGRTWCTPRPTRTAVLAVGYADGYPRQASGREAAVLIGGQRCPVLGRVTMDQIIADTTAMDTPPQPGDEAVLIGTQGQQEITAGELAAWGQTIPWDIFTGLGPRAAPLFQFHILIQLRIEIPGFRLRLLFPGHDFDIFKLHVTNLQVLIFHPRPAIPGGWIQQLHHVAPHQEAVRQQICEIGLIEVKAVHISLQFIVSPHLRFRLQSPQARFLPGLRGLLLFGRGAAGRQTRHEAQAGQQGNPFHIHSMIPEPEP
jgi:alanine racemase